MGKRILIVDSNDTNLDIYSYFLKELNFIVLHANSGAAALEQLKSTKVDLIITAIRLPSTNGILLADKIRSNKLACENNVPIIGLCTAKIEEDWCVPSLITKHLMLPVEKGDFQYQVLDCLK